jgi:hypothetical protein
MTAARRSVGDPDRRRRTTPTAQAAPTAVVRATATAGNSRVIEPTDSPSMRLRGKKKLSSV